MRTLGSGGLTRAGLLAAALAVAPALAQNPGPSPEPDHMPPRDGMAAPEMKLRADRRFPQPVRVGALIGRALLRPVEWQPVLGRVAGLARRDDGTLEMIVRLDGRLGLDWLGLGWAAWPGFGSRRVSVPVDAVALLGEHVGLMGLTPDALQALPDFGGDPALGVGPDEAVRVGLVAPFH